MPIPCLAKMLDLELFWSDKSYPNPFANGGAKIILDSYSGDDNLSSFHKHVLQFVQDKTGAIVSSSVSRILWENKGIILNGDAREKKRKR